MRLYQRLVVAIAFIGLSLHIGQAQTNSGQISGRVTDPAGAAVKGAEVSLINQATGGSPLRRDESSGEFVFVGV